MKMQTVDGNGSPVFTGVQEDTLRKAVQIEELAVYCDQAEDLDEANTKGAHEMLERVRYLCIDECVCGYRM
jgi:hypothetical protein